MQVTRDELKQILARHRGASAVSLYARTVPEMRKKNNPFHGRVAKLSRVVGMIGFRYSASVNRQRAREGRPTDRDGAVPWFVAEPRKWGKPWGKSPLIEHLGRFYLEVKVNRGQSQVEYEEAETGRKITHTQLAPYLRKRSRSKKQGVENEVLLRDYALESIVQLRMGGDVFDVVHRSIDLAAQTLKASQITTIAESLLYPAIAELLDAAGGPAAFVDAQLPETSDRNRRRVIAVLEKRLERYREQHVQVTA